MMNRFGVILFTFLCGLIFCSASYYTHDIDPPWYYEGPGNNQRFFAQFNPTNGQGTDEFTDKTVLPDEYDYYEVWYDDADNGIVQAMHYVNHNLRDCHYYDGDEQLVRTEIWYDYKLLGYYEYKYDRNQKCWWKAKYILRPNNSFATKWWLKYEYRTDGSHMLTHTMIYYYDEFEAGFFFAEYVLHYDRTEKLRCYQKRWVQQENGPFPERWAFFRHDEDENIKDRQITEENFNRILDVID